MLPIFASANTRLGTGGMMNYLAILFLILSGTATAGSINMIEGDFSLRIDPTLLKKIEQPGDQVLHLEDVEFQIDSSEEEWVATLSNPKNSPAQEQEGGVDFHPYGQVAIGAPFIVGAGAGIVIGPEDFTDEAQRGFIAQAFAGITGARVSLGWGGHRRKWDGWFSFPGGFAVLLSGFRNWQRMEDKLGYKNGVNYIGPELEASLMYITGRVGVLCGRHDGDTDCRFSGTIGGTL